MPTDDLKRFEESKNGQDAYIAVTKKDYDNGTTISVGDDKEYPSNSRTGRRKRRSTAPYRNAPLTEGKQYAIFIRVFYDENEVSSHILISF